MKNIITAKHWKNYMFTTLTGLFLLFMGASPASAQPLKIGINNNPAFAAWQIGAEKGWFEQAGVEVQLEWRNYMETVEAFSLGELDAASMTNGDALTTSTRGRPMKAVLINGMSNGNNLIIARKGITSVRDLVGKKVAVEFGFFSHHLLQIALKLNGINEQQLVLLEMQQDQAGQAFEGGIVDAIVTWQPYAKQALDHKGAHTIFSSANVKGSIYDMLCVSEESLAKRRTDWEKVVGVWFRIENFIKDPVNHKEVAAILAQRMGVKEKESLSHLKGIALFDLKKNLKAFEKQTNLLSVYGSTKMIDTFNLNQHLYKEALDLDIILHPDLVKDLNNSGGGATAGTSGIPTNLIHGSVAAR